MIFYQKSQFSSHPHTMKLKFLVLFLIFLFITGLVILYIPSFKEATSALPTKEMTKYVFELVPDNANPSSHIIKCKKDPPRSSLVSQEEFLKDFDAYLTKLEDSEIDMSRVNTIDYLELSSMDKTSDFFSTCPIPRKRETGKISLTDMIRMYPQILAPIEAVLNRHHLTIARWGEAEGSVAPMNIYRPWKEQFQKFAALRNMEIRPYAWNEKGRDNQIIPNRGRITDRHGKILVENKPAYDIIVDLVQLKEVKQCIHILAYDKASNDQDWSKWSEQDRLSCMSSLTYHLSLECYEKGYSLNNNQEAKINTKVAELYFQETVDIVTNLLSDYLQENRERIKSSILQEKKAPEEIKKRLVLRKNLTKEKVLELQAILAPYKLSETIKFRKNNLRLPLNDSHLAHVLGYTNHEEKGMQGIELACDELLRGTPGNPNLPPKAGQNVQLTIDSSLQILAEDELKKGMVAAKAHQGCVIIMSPKSGEILAMASLPAYNNRTKEGITDNSHHFAIQGLFEPGGLSRIFTATAAWDSGNKTPESMIDCSELNVQKDIPTLKDKTQTHTHLSSSDCLTQYSIPGTARLGMSPGWGCYQKYLQAYGLLNKIIFKGYGFKECISPSLTTGTNPVNYSRISLGYGIAITPLHVAVAYATLANNGERPTPRIVLSPPHNDPGKNAATTKRVTVMKPETSAALLKLLQDNVQKGAGKTMSLPGVSLGGFTGTSFTSHPQSGYISAPTLSCAGVFPIEKPEYVCVVVLTDTRAPNKSNTQAAAEIFKSVVSKLASIKN